MSWEYVKFRIRKRAEGALCAVSSYIHDARDEDNPEQRLEEYLRKQARLREYEEGIL
jgi:hypothetical protein